MKRLKKYSFQVHDEVRFKKHPFDTSIYKITQVFDDDTFFIDNGKVSYTNIKASALELVKKEET